MRKMPVYKGIMETKTSFGIPTIFLMTIGVLTLILGIILKTFLVIIPSIIIISMLKIISKKDSKFLLVYFSNLSNPEYLGF